MKRNTFLITSLLGVLALIHAQSQPEKIVGDINKRPGKPAIAVPDFRGAGDAQRFMNTFNATLFSDLQSSGQLKMVPKTLYPLQIPQQPTDFHPPAGGRSQGIWLTD